MVKIFDRLGYSTEYLEEQTCCGQPAFNSGYWREARTVAERTLKIFQDAEVIVSASGSCAAMLKAFYSDLFQGTEQEEEAKILSSKVHEFSSFLVNILRVTDIGATFHGKVTFHDGCHGLRELGIQREPRELLRNVRGLELIEMQEAKTCCGFGGAFAVKFPEISTAMAEVKCDSIGETKADYVISNDSSCLMQIQGLLSRQGCPIRTLHLAEVLASMETNPPHP